MCNNTKDWEDYRKDVSNSEKLGEYKRERLKTLLDICEKSKDSSYDLPIDCKIYLPLGSLLFEHEMFDFITWADKMGYIRCESETLSFNMYLTQKGGNSPFNNTLLRNEYHTQTANTHRDKRSIDSPSFG